jgi:hypothetical protein
VTGTARKRFETDEKVAAPFQVTAEGGHCTMGQQIWFLGYPYGIGSRWSNGGEAPFIKKGTMSALDATNHDTVVLYIDGFNNPGFSGGPIVYWDFNKHAYGIAGVVKGYKEDTAKVLISGERVDTQILVNSGIPSVITSKPASHDHLKTGQRTLTQD